MPDLPGVPRDIPGHSKPQGKDMRGAMLVGADLRGADL